MIRSIIFILILSFFVVACNQTKTSDDFSETNSAPPSDVPKQGAESEGGVDGGGGQALVCRSDAGDILSAEVLDLYEGRAQYGLTPIENEIPYLEQVNQIFEKNLVFKEPVVKDSKYYTRNVIEKMRLLPADVALKPIDDSHEVIAPKKCKIEQAVNYVNDETILFDSEIWKKLNESNKAALILHEGIYRLVRDLDFFTRKPLERNSIRARHFVSFLFSGGIAGQLRNKEWADTSVSGQCNGGHASGNSTLFLFSKASNGQVQIHFLNLAGKIVLAPAVMDEIKVFESSITPEKIFFDYLQRYGSNEYYNLNFSGNIKSDFEKGDYVSFYKNNDEFKMTYVDGRTNRRATFNLSCMFH